MARRLAVACLAVVAFGWLTAGRASAHAELLAITPPDGAILEAAPAEASLLFSEQVSLTGGSARVLDDSGATVSGDPQVIDDTVVVPLPPGLAEGTYTLSWQVVSQDSHRITGASVFHVGEPSTTGGAVVSPDGGEEVAWGVRALAGGLTAVAYAGALVGVGGWWFAELIARRRDAISLVGTACAVGVAATVAGVPARIARVGGGLDALRDWDFVRESLAGPIGWSARVTAVFLLVVGMGARRASGTRWRWILAAAGAAALGGFAIEGHTRSMTPRWAMVGFDLVHLGAGALWIGGLAVVVRTFRHGVDRPEQAGLVARFSDAAVVAVLAVTAAGVGMSWLVLPSLDDLWSTGYGLALIVKVTLVAVVIGLGAFNRRHLVPAVSAGAAAGPRRRLARIVTAELAILLVVVGVTAVLVARSPVSAEPGPAAAPAPIPDAVDVPLSGEAGTASITLSPARAGSNEMRLSLTAPDGGALVPVETPTVELTEPNLELGPLRPLVHPFGGGEYHVIVEIPLAGSWEITVRVRISDFEAATATTTIEVAE